LVVVSGQVGNAGEVRDSLKRWLTRQAKATLLPWLAELSEGAGLPFQRVAVRGQRTRWGSCSARGNINLNYKLLFLPPDLVRYILHHELCHIVHLNHSRSFWKLLATLEPDYRVFNTQAKRGMDHVPEWAK
jgi:predicted metal-dependent hydrolase